MKKEKKTGLFYCLLAILLTVGMMFSVTKKQEQREQAAAILEEKQRQEAEKKARKVAETAEKQKDNYAYSMLDAQGKQLYAQILNILMEFGEEEEVTVQSPEEIEPVFQCVMNDHPELFYVEGYTYTKYTAGEELQKITFTGSYTMDREEASQRMEEVDAVAEEWLAGIRADSSQYEKVKYVYEAVISHTEYDLEAPDNQNICSVLLQGRSVCQGYAKATQYLLAKLGIFSTLVTGQVDSGEGHAWNLVRIDGAYYYVDTTWGDAYYLLEGEAPSYKAGNMPSINYDYLCVTTEQLLKTHSIDNVVGMPDCVSMEANYYVMEGAYFETADVEHVQNLFEKAYAAGEELVTLKCADEAVYEELLEQLIEGQEVFRYLEKGRRETVAYSCSPEQLSISFWL